MVTTTGVALMVAIVAISLVAPIIPVAVVTITFTTHEPIHLCDCIHVCLHSLGQMPFYIVFCRGPSLRVLKDALFYSFSSYLWCCGLMHQWPWFV